jgi:hypothetical protein
MEAPIERVQTVRPVERDDAISIADVGQDQILVHCVLPIGLFVAAIAGNLLLTNRSVNYIVHQS